ncbi:MAG: hypothetical protein NWQ23_06010 [Yoonia sp.]|uniref:hypothetical protein n=1 Tax=Yoonia sp. TaxID=2212373 RepID=UPI00273D6758|nr:hypothetical protein [Yoonia sp.]MDP5084958.1 hypothetical protein [Yoonia sp.]MDP5362620.1 hypothetical protein [Paracoccaceae bacterium]
MIRIRPIFFAAVLAMLGGQSQALSCLRPDPITTFQQLAAAPEGYFVLYGRLTFDEGALPAGTSMDQSRVPEPIAARFAGKGLTRDGFTNTYVSDVTLQVGCLGPWCGSARSGVDAIYFVEATDPPVTMQAQPCGEMIFENPSQATLDMLTSCMQGGACSPQPLQ